MKRRSTKGQLHRRHAMLISLALGAFAVLGVLVGGGSAASTAAPENTSPPTVTGTPQEGQTLRGDRGAWTGGVTDYNYFWTRCNRSGGSCNNISGAHAATYTLRGADVGRTIRFKVEAKNASGSTFASSVPTAVIAAAPKVSAPVNTSPPTISGSAEEGQRLTGNGGAWSNNPTGFVYTWTRCDRTGNACADISSTNSTQYTLTSADVGNTVRFKVRASNAGGSNAGISAPTAVVLAPGQALTVDQISLPDRLVVDGVKFFPNPTRTRRPIVARFHVSETARGRSVQGALVYALGLPYGWVRNAPETATDSAGWATIALQPTATMPLRRGALVVFVRARKPGENVLAGVSTRRLVQESIR
jgi:hypothetical protein